MQPKQQSSKATRQPGSKAAGQQGSKAAGIQDLAVDFKIWQLTSYLSLNRGHSSPPNGSTGRRSSSPPPSRPGPETGAAAPTGVSNSLLWLPWSAQCIPNVLEGLQGASQLGQGIQKSSPADFLRGRRQRRKPINIYTWNIESCM